MSAPPLHREKTNRIIEHRTKCKGGGEAPSPAPSSLRRDQRADGADAPEAPFAPMEVGDGGTQIVGAEVGPQGVDEAELGVGAFPEEKIGQPLFAAGADEEIDLGAGALPREQPAEGLA